MKKQALGILFACSVLFGCSNSSNESNVLNMNSTRSLLTSCIDNHNETSCRVLFRAINEDAGKTYGELNHLCSYENNISSCSLLATSSQSTKENKLIYAKKACDLDNSKCDLVAKQYFNYEPVSSDEYDKAEYYYNLQYEGFKKNNDNLGMVSALLSIKNIYDSKQDKVTAKKFSKKACSLVDYSDPKFHYIISHYCK